MQGPSHQKMGLPGQDAQAYQVIAEDILVIALADGAGTAEHSEEGANLAVAQALGGMTKGLDSQQPRDEPALEKLVIDAFQQARQALLEVAWVSGNPPDSFATTLTCAVASGQWLAVGQIGDGAVVARVDNGELFTVTRPQRGEYANETYFLTMEDALDRLQVDAYATAVSALAVMSDGLTRLALKMPGHEPHLPFFQPLLDFTAGIEDECRASEQLAAFLTSERVCARADDDKALVLAVRSSAFLTEAKDWLPAGESGSPPDLIES